MRCVVRRWGTSAQPDEAPIFWRRIIDRNYFRTMRIPLIRGREFSEQDDSSPPTAIMNETMARRYWPGADPIGKRFGSPNRWLTWSVSWAT